MALPLGTNEIERMVKAPLLLLMLDCDGTLAPIARHYRRAVFPSKAKEILKKIARAPGVKIAIVSGRSLENLRRFVGVRGLIYSGNHGLEMKNGGKIEIHPGARRYLGVMSELGMAIEALLEYFPNADLENKRFGLSLHYRRLAPRMEKKLFYALKTAIKPFVSSRKVRILGGKKVWEVRPAIRWDKGRAAQWLVRTSGPGPALPVFIGDDTTDEDAFNALKNGITVRVGHAKDTRAGFYLRSHSDVYRLLQKLHRERILRHE